MSERTNYNHKGYSFNCLTPEQFELFCQTVEEGEEFYCDCEECQTASANIDPYDNRCHCGNRRVYFQYDDIAKEFYAEVD